MELKVKSTGSTKSFQLTGIDSSLTVAELKKKCEEECGIAPDQQRLFLKGKQLKDEETLDGAHVTDKSTLFLAVGAHAGGASGSTASGSEAKEKKEDEAPAVTVPCLGGCGFFGTAKTENYCSKCYAKKQQKDQEEAGKVKKEREEAEKAKDSAQEESGKDEAATQEGTAREEQKDKTKCWACAKKCGLTGFDCRCGYTFCSKHRYAEDHNCDFDHKGRGREILAKNNPNISLKGGGVDPL